MSVSIHGDFAIHRTKDANGKDAILLVPENADVPLWYGSDGQEDLCPISFEHVEGGENPPDSYLTITYASGDKTHFGPNIVMSRTKN